MAKEFFKGRQDKRENHVGAGFNTKRHIKRGSNIDPLSLTVKTEERKAEINVLLEENALSANIEVNSDVEENISELSTLLETPKTIVLEVTPNRNEPCSCGSGKKYKKCCG